MKILLFTLEYPPFRGGVANYYGNLVKYWPSIPVPLNKGGEGGLYILHNNDGRLLNNKLPILKWLPSVFRLWREIKKEKINHVLVGHLLPLGTATFFVSKFLKIKYSVILHGFDLSMATRGARKKRLASRILRNADKIICNSDYVANEARKFIGGKDALKVAVVNPGVEVESENEFEDGLIDKYELREKFVLLSVGRLVERKGFDIVIESLPNVLKVVPNLFYVIIGDGEEFENLKLKIENLGLRGNVVIIKDADDKQKNSWYGICDIFIMPARNINGDYEGFGIVYLEANLAGKPVVAGDAGGVRDAVVNGVNGLLVNPESAEDVGRAIVKLAGDSDYRERLGARGRARAIRDFNWEGQAKKMYNILK